MSFVSELESVIFTCAHGLRETRLALRDGVNSAITVVGVFSVVQARILVGSNGAIKAPTGVGRLHHLLCFAGETV